MTQRVQAARTRDSASARLINSSPAHKQQTGSTNATAVRARQTATTAGVKGGCRQLRHFLAYLALMSDAEDDLDFTAAAVVRDAARSDSRCRSWSSRVLTSTTAPTEAHRVGAASRHSCTHTHTTIGSTHCVCARKGDKRGKQHTTGASEHNSRTAATHFSHRSRSSSSAR